MPRKPYERTKKEINPLFSKRLKRFREERDLTQEDVAKALNLSVFSISKYELAKSEPYISTVQKLSEIYNVDPAYFIDPDWDEKEDNDV